MTSLTCTLLPLESVHVPVWTNEETEARKRRETGPRPRSKSKPGWDLGQGLRQPELPHLGSCDALAHLALAGFDVTQDGIS